MLERLQAIVSARRPDAQDDDDGFLRLGHFTHKKQIPLLAHRGCAFPPGHEPQRTHQTIGLPAVAQLADQHLDDPFRIGLLRFKRIGPADRIPHGDGMPVVFRRLDLQRRATSMRSCSFASRGQGMTDISRPSPMYEDTTLAIATVSAASNPGQSISARTPGRNGA